MPSQPSISFPRRENRSRVYPAPSTSPPIPNPKNAGQRFRSHLPAIGATSAMDSDQGKLFIGGISWETSEDNLKEYFGQYGEVLLTVTMRDKVTGRPRGFGFVVFADPSVLDKVLQDKHSIDGRTVEAKRAMSREEQHVNPRSGNNANNGRNFTGANNVRTKKIFVGGLPATLSEEGFRQYFENYGTVTDVVVMYDQHTQRPRGFGFISFDSEDAVDNVLHKTFHELNGKLVEVKRALPKDANPGSGGRTGSGYQVYGGGGSNNSSYDNRMETGRYGQSQTAAGGYPGYGSSGYGATGYGYGAAGNGVGYGYGMGAYGGAGAGYGGPPGAYGNPNAPNAGYGAARGPWSSQGPSGYGSTGYGVGYGAGGAWSGSTGMGGALPAGGGISAPSAGQSLNAASGYGSQGYGYGGYGNSGGAGGDQQGDGAGYMGGGYGDANPNSVYSSWRPDSSQAGNYGASQANAPAGGQIGYPGGGYGGAQSRQAQGK